MGIWLKSILSHSEVGGERLEKCIVAGFFSRRFQPHTISLLKPRKLSKMRIVIL